MPLARKCGRFCSGSARASRRDAGTPGTGAPGHCAAGLRQKAFELKQRQIDADDAEAVVMSCGSCRLNFMNGKANTARPVKVESLVELVGNNLQN